MTKPLMNYFLKKKKQVWDTLIDLLNQTEGKSKDNFRSQFNLAFWFSFLLDSSVI